MTDEDFAERFEDLFRTTYVRAVRRARDKRERLSPETVALLEHMAAAGPMTAGELARHIDRAPSTLTEMLRPLEARGLIERHRDPDDARKALIWLSPPGQAALAESRRVLEPGLLAAAAGGLSPGERAEFHRLFKTFTSHLHGARP
jgi:DNA-binding MarR family transcriptional regulator